MVFINDHLFQVGRLFYAIVISDSRIEPLEMQEFKEALKAYHKILQTIYGREDMMDVHSVDQIIEMVTKEALDSREYFAKFKHYYLLHTDEFSNEQKDLIMLKVNRIGSSFAKQNKSELVLIAKTRLLLYPI